MGSNRLTRIQPRFSDRGTHDVYTRSRAAKKLQRRPRYRDTGTRSGKLDLYETNVRPDLTRLSPFRSPTIHPPPLYQYRLLQRKLPISFRLCCVDRRHGNSFSHREKRRRRKEVPYIGPRSFVKVNDRRGGFSRKIVEIRRLPSQNIRRRASTRRFRAECWSALTS